MKLISFCLVLVLLQLSIPLTSAQSSTDNSLVLNDGTPIKLQLSRGISSVNAKTGESVEFEVVEDVVLNDYIVVPKGSIASATVTRAKRKGRFGRGGKLDISIESVQLGSGDKIPLRAVRESTGNGRTGTMAGAMILTSTLFFPAAPLFILMKGKDINLSKGSRVTAYTHGNVSLNSAEYELIGESQNLNLEN